MSQRSWTVLMIVGVIVTGLVALASQIDIPIIDKAIHPRIECQDSPSCRAFLHRTIIDAIRAERRRELRGGVRSNGPPPGHSPPGGGPGPAPPRPSPQPPPHPGSGPAPHPAPPPKPPPVLTVPPINLCTQKPLPPACVNVPPITVP